MATSVQQSFEELKTNLEITELQQSTVSARQQNVREIVQTELSTWDSFLTGSYSRNTMIAPLREADIDIFIVMNSSYWRNDGQAYLLDTVRGVLRKSYPKTDISRNGQAVTIEFADFKVDVVPAFCRKGGGYLIPNTLERTWISTDPKKHIEIMSNANKATNGKLVPLIKMIKAWNRNINNYFNSFHLEVLALQIFYDPNASMPNFSIPSFSTGMQYFFYNGYQLIDKNNPDPAGYGGDVGYYLKSQGKIGSALNLFKNAYEIADIAVKWEKNGISLMALMNWKGILGNYFPSYG